MTETEIEALASWLRERVPGYEVDRETTDGAHRIDVHESVDNGKKGKKKKKEKNGAESGHLRIPTAFFEAPHEAPSLAELQRALESANVASLLTKGRRLRVRAPEGTDGMRKVWVEDLPE